MKKTKIFILALVGMLSSSCLDDLNTKPEVEDTLENIIAKDPNAINGALAKLYASLSVHGQGDAEGSDQFNDTKSTDSGTSPFLRGYWNFQELTADLVKNGWGDPGLDPLTLTTGWSSSNALFTYYYDRIVFTTVSCNNFINEVNKINPSNKDQLLAEARFLRAFAYYQGMDCFGKFGLLTEKDKINGPAPAEANRQQLFNYIVNELNEIKSVLPNKNEYGRASGATASMLLAKLYLNAEVYIGQSKYTECITELNKVIASGYSLAPNYLLNTSGNNSSSPELIFTLNADREQTRGFGNTTYIVNGSYTADAINVNYGVTADGSGAWGGHRCTPRLYSLFGNLATTTDKRALFQTQSPFTYDMTDIRKFTNGYPTTKFRNAPTIGTAVATKFSDVDFPVFRLADAYLMYTEAVLRGGSGGSIGQALTYVNQIRTRAGLDALGSSSVITLDYILDERARELYYEGHRRQDLIRFGKFTGSTYLWPWKGGVKDGTGIPSYYNVFPVPLDALNANPNLKQNPGY